MTFPCGVSCHLQSIGSLIGAIVQINSVVSVPLPGFKSLIVRHLEPLLNKGCRVTFGKGDLKSRFQPLSYNSSELYSFPKYFVVLVLTFWQTSQDFRPCFGLPKSRFIIEH